MPVSVTLTCCKKATAVSSAVDTFPAATSPARGAICKLSRTLLSVKSASAIGAPQIAPSLSVSSALMVILIFVISPLKFDGVAIRISGKLASSPVCPLAPVRALMVTVVPTATSTKPEPLSMRIVPPDPTGFPIVFERTSLPSRSAKLTFIMSFRLKYLSS